ncbi:MAG TPA: glycosyltransferase, partial [Candidatus Binatia bacterium]|nr:glycosyltransferase [Candidatus Binatia bacterium]
MRIAYVTETWHPAINGVVTRLSATVRELARRGHDVLVVAPGAFDQPLEGVRVQGVRSVSIPFIYGGE